jgi:hypothetical protein
MIAYEMAQQLRRSGETVAGLVLIDPVPKHFLSPWLSPSTASAARHRLRAAVRLARSQITARGNRNLSGVKRRRMVLKSVEAAVALYRPAPYDGATLLLHSKEYGEMLVTGPRSFPKLVRGLDVVESGDGHLSVLESYLQPSSKAITEFLDRVAPL